jgi:outer membrane protein OmpA-like peptidoglycan-associated protein
MRRSMLRGLGAAAIVSAIAIPAAGQLADDVGKQLAAGVPVLGVDVGATIPISDFQRTADPGGAIAPFVGYQIGVPFIQGFTFTPIFQPQFAAFSTCGCDDLASITSLTAGARFALTDVHSEAYFGAQGGYYWTTNGPREHDDGAGFNIQGGYNYEFLTGTALGLYLRLDQAHIHPFTGADNQTTQFLVTGLELQHRFLPPPPAPPPPPPAAPAAAPPPTPPVKKKIVLRGVNFDFNKANVRPDAMPILDEAAATLKESGDVTIAVNGYTDAIGSDAYNERLSVRRATAVKDYLEQHGVAAGRMTVRGFGKADPVASNATPEGRAQNRRVELIVNNP